MKYIDLHVHSNVSDGTLTPVELVYEAYNCRLSAFALTDHDTVAGVRSAKETAKKMKAQDKHIQVISGVELSLAYMGRDIHMLGLFVDEEDPNFKAKLSAIKQERDQRNQKMVDNLANSGIDISMEALLAVDANAVITRAHFAKHLVQTGAVKDNQEAFSKYLSEDSPYYVPREYLSPKQGIDLIKSAGGIPILAHPLLYHFTHAQLDTLIRSLKEDGLMGLEVIYSMNTGFDEGYLKKFIHEYDLLTTGGSDFHGANKPLIQMGTGKGNLKIPIELLEKLEARL